MASVRRVVVALLLAMCMCNSTGAQESKEEFFPFGRFKEKLDSSLNGVGVDPEVGNYHFVVLMNSVRVEGPRAAWIRNIYYGLLKQYLITGDIVSFAPFQLDVDSSAQWNRAYSPRVADELYRNVPCKSVYANGHDIEQALLTALTTATKPQSCIYVVLSDIEVSEAPSPSAGYTLAQDRPEFDSTMAELGTRRLEKSRIDGESPDVNGRLVPVTVFYRIYAPQDLEPIRPLDAGHTRRELVAEQMANWPRTEEPTTHGRTEPVDKGQDTGIVDLLLCLLPTALAVIGLILYVAWLYRDRMVEIGPQRVSVRYGTKVFIGGEGADSKVKAVPGLPDGQRVAHLELTLSGAVVLVSEGFYSVSRAAEKNRVMITPTPKTITVQDNREIDEVYQIQARTVK